MKNKFIITVLILLLKVQLFSQKEIAYSKDFEITLGEQYLVKDFDKREYFIDSEGNVILLKIGINKVNVQSFNVSDQNKLSEKEYKDFPQKIKYQKTILLENKLYFFYCLFDNDEKREKLYSREINFNGGTFEEPALILTVDEKVDVKSTHAIEKHLLLNGGNYEIKFEFELSTDKSKLLIHCKKLPEKLLQSKIFDEIGLYVFDNKLSKLWFKETKMSLSSREIDIISYGITNIGQAFFISYNIDSKDYHLFRFSEDEIYNDVKINFKNKIKFQELNAIETKEGDLDFISYYYNQKESELTMGIVPQYNANLNGISNFKVDKEGNVYNEVKIDFPLEIINLYESKKRSRKNNRKEEAGSAGISNLRLIDFETDEDGNKYIVGEEIIETVSYNGSPIGGMPVGGVPSSMGGVPGSMGGMHGTVGGMHGGGGASTAIYYKDIIITKLDKDGLLLWMKKIPKYQTTQSSGLNVKKEGLGFKKTVNDNFINFYFSDDSRNIALNEDEEPMLYREGYIKGVLMNYKINKLTGEMEKKVILSLKKVNDIKLEYFCPKYMIPFSNDELYLETLIYRGKKNAILKIKSN